MSIAPASPFPTRCDLVRRTDTGLAASDIALLEAGALEAGALEVGGLDAGGSEAEVAGVLRLAGADEVTALDDVTDAALCELFPHAATRVASATKAAIRIDDSTGLLYVA
jgi:hypothetical protein